MIITRATPHQHLPGRVTAHHRTQSRPAVTLPEPCLWAGGRFAAFVSSSGKFLALAVKKPAGRTPSVETCNGPHQRRRQKPRGLSSKTTIVLTGKETDMTTARWCATTYPPRPGPGITFNPRSVLPKRQGTPRAAAPCR